MLSLSYVNFQCSPQGAQSSLADHLPTQNSIVQPDADEDSDEGAEADADTETNSLTFGNWGQGRTQKQDGHGKPKRRTQNNKSTKMLDLTAAITSSPTMVKVRQNVRTFLHENAIASKTSVWYNAVLNRLPSKSRILIVGIATGSALLQNAHLLRAKEMTVVGIDSDADFIMQCNRNVSRQGLQHFIKARLANIEDYKPPSGTFFTHVYFNCDFMMASCQTAHVLRRYVDFLVDREDGRVFFTHSFQLEKSFLLEWIKPKLTSITSVSFGPVLYLDDFEEWLYSAGLVIVDIERLEDGAEVANVRESRLVEARSNLYVTPSKGTIN